MLAAIALISIPLIFTLACIAVSEAAKARDWRVWAATVIVLAAVCGLWYQMACAVRMTRAQADQLARDFMDQPKAVPSPKLSRDKTTGSGMEIE